MPINMKTWGLGFETRRFRQAVLFDNSKCPVTPNIYLPSPNYGVRPIVEGSQLLSENKNFSFLFRTDHINPMGRADYKVYYNGLKSNSFRINPGTNNFYPAGRLYPYHKAALPIASV
jgi:hypothetical protein